MSMMIFVVLLVMVNILPSYMAVYKLVRLTDIAIVTPVFVLSFLRLFFIDEASAYTIFIIFVVIIVIFVYLSCRKGFKNKMKTWLDYISRVTNAKWLWLLSAYSLIFSWCPMLWRERCCSFFLTLAELLTIASSTFFP